MTEAGTTPITAQGGGWRPPPGGGYPPASPPGSLPGGGAGKPVTGGPQTMALYATTLDSHTGLPRGEKPPAGTAAVVALICGLLLCLGPFTGITAIVAGFMGRSAARQNPDTVGGGGMALAGILLGVLNLLISVVALLIFLMASVG